MSTELVVVLYVSPEVVLVTELSIDPPVVVEEPNPNKEPIPEAIFPNSPLLH